MSLAPSAGRKQPWCAPPERSTTGIHPVTNSSNAFIWLESISKRIMQVSIDVVAADDWPVEAEPLNQRRDAAGLGAGTVVGVGVEEEAV